MSVEYELKYNTYAFWLEQKKKMTNISIFYFLLISARF